VKTQTLNKQGKGRCVEPHKYKDYCAMTFIAVGLDIGKASFYAALLVGAIEDKPKVKEFVNNPEGYRALVEWLQSHGVNQCHVCLEATSTYGHGVATYLHGLGFQVSIVNPLRVKGFGQAQMSRTKNDQADAGLIARYCAIHRPAAWRPTTPEQSSLQQTGRHWQALSHLISQERNRLETVTDSTVRQIIKDHITYIQTQQTRLLDALEEQLKTQSVLQSDVKLIESIPGIGRKTALLLVAELGDIRSFDSSRQLAAFAGLTPQEHSSGTSVHGKTRLCKMGSPRLRFLLYMPAIASLRFNPPIQDLRARMLAAGKQKMQVVGAAMHKLIRFVYGVVNSGKPFDPQLSLPPSTAK
jgi:transposase